MSGRRERFRQYMARLSAAAHPQDVIKQDLYVPRPGGAVADHLVRRLELEPASSHLLVGGVGSGKTTQLLILQKDLAETQDVHASFIDVSEVHDLAKLHAGVLVVLAGLTIGGLISKEHTSQDVLVAQQRFKNWAHGYVEWADMRDAYEPPDEEPPDEDMFMHPVYTKGILIPPTPSLRGDIREKGLNLQTLTRAAGHSLPHVVLIFDSLDRLTDMKAFAEVIEQDIRVIKSASVGVVMVGPLRTLFGKDRPLTDRFDHFYHLPSVDVQQDSRGAAFLGAVLRKRVTAELLPDEPLRQIVHFSGGVLRDLISLARSAGEEAYTAGAERVRLTDVESAADAFGRTMILGLGSDELEILQRVKTTGNFVQTSDKDVALLVTRRVLEYGNGSRRYIVHPTIIPLLEELTPKR